MALGEDNVSMKTINKKIRKAVDWFSCKANHARRRDRRKKEKKDEDPA